MLRILSIALVALGVIILFALVSVPTRAQPAIPAGEWAGGKECHFYTYAEDSYCIPVSAAVDLAPTTPPPTLDPTYTAPTATPTPEPTATPWPTNTPRPTPTPIRVQIEVLTRGNGATAVAGDTVVVHYTGWLTDGTKFDSSLDRGRPFEFELGAGIVIQGWDEGVVGMRVGGKRRLTIPPELAYGDRSVGDVIPPGATLVFELELLEVR